MRFLVDACVDVSVNCWLCEQGHDSTHLRDQNLQRLPDGHVFTKAAAEQRVIVTIDLDFGEILSFSRGAVVSTITLLVHNTWGPFLIRRLEAGLSDVIRFLDHGAIVIIEDSRYVRHLPIHLE